MNDAASYGWTSLYDNNGTEGDHGAFSNTDVSLHLDVLPLQPAFRQQVAQDSRCCRRLYRLSYRSGYFADGSARTEEPPKARTRLLQAERNLK